MVHFEDVTQIHASETDFHPRRSHFTALWRTAKLIGVYSLSNEYMGTFIAEKMTNLAVESTDKERVKCESNGEEDSDNSCLETPLDFAIADAWHFGVKS